MRANDRLLLLVSVCLCGVSACQIERDRPTDPRREEAIAKPDGSTPRSDDDRHDDSGPSDNGPSGEDRSGDDGQSGGQKEPQVDSMSNDAGMNSNASDGDANTATTPDASVNGSAVGACTAPEVDGCNPVKNEGCLTELSMQCAVDPLADTPSGYCTFSAPSDAGGCLNTLVTESCPPTQTCFEGQCRKLCFCNGDCQQGECCVEPVGVDGFKACGKC